MMADATNDWLSRANFAAMSDVELAAYERDCLGGVNQQRVEREIRKRKAKGEWSLTTA
jgi:hypothetical protein